MTYLKKLLAFGLLAFGCATTTQAQVSIRDVTECTRVLTAQYANCEMVIHFECSDGHFLKEHKLGAETALLSEYFPNGGLNKYEYFAAGFAAQVIEQEVLFNTEELFSTGRTFDKARQRLSAPGNELEITVSNAVGLLPSVAFYGGQRYPQIKVLSTMDVRSIGKSYNELIQMIYVRALDTYVHEKTLQMTGEDETPEADHLLTLAFPGDPGFDETQAQYNCGDTS